MPKRKIPKRVRSNRSSDLADHLPTAIELHRAGKLTQAERAYQKILASHPEQAVVQHLLGRLYWETNRRSLAIDSLRRALALRSDYAEALLDLSNMLSESGQLEQAEESLRQLVRVRPQDGMAYNNLGVVLKDLGQYQAAISAYRQALDVQPRNSATLCNLAHVQALVGDLDEAASGYRAAIACDPGNVDALSCLASLLRRMARHDEARDVFAAWLQLEPDNPVPLHLLAAYDRANVPERASDQYVRHVFDQFAATFDNDLQRLDYQGPQLIEHGLTREFAEAKLFDRVLDAGCGTGLCGPVLRDYARCLIGVDLSPKMLHVAKQRQLYDELIEAELSSYLSQHESEFDLIACADTFGYFGDLNVVFAAARRALRPAGTLLVTVELGDIAALPGYQLTASGRYAHHLDYVSRCCTAAGLAIKDQTLATLRMEADQAVPTLVLTASAGV